MLFVDVRGFTSLSERTSPIELASIMNRFYESSTNVVIRLDGTVDKLVGNQIMAFLERRSGPRTMPNAPFRPL